jgi:hypothetical protein
MSQRPIINKIKKVFYIFEPVDLLLGTNKLDDHLSLSETGHFELRQKPAASSRFFLIVSETGFRILFEGPERLSGREKKRKTCRYRCLLKMIFPVYGPLRSNVEPCSLR